MCGDVCSCGPTVLKVKKPAPYFESLAWYNNGIRNIKLTDYKGIFFLIFILLIRQMVGIILLSS